jgi:hypothetical protein
VTKQSKANLKSLKLRSTCSRKRWLVIGMVFRGFEIIGSENRTKIPSTQEYFIV